MTDRIRRFGVAACMAGLLTTSGQILLADIGPPVVQAIKDRKCVAILSPQKCFAVGDSYCQELSNCSGGCVYCQSSQTMPNHACLVWYGETCTTGFPNQSPPCDEADRYVGQCTTENGTSSCGCHETYVDGDCSSTTAQQCSPGMNPPPTLP